MVRGTTIGCQCKGNLESAAGFKPSTIGLSGFSRLDGVGVGSHLKCSLGIEPGTLHESIQLQYNMGVITCQLK